MSDLRGTTPTKTLLNVSRRSKRESIIRKLQKQKNTNQAQINIYIHNTVRPDRGYCCVYAVYSVYVVYAVYRPVYAVYSVYAVYGALIEGTVVSMLSIVFIGCL